jgi:hypothetical protein
MPQTSYSIAPAAGYRGLPYDISTSVKRTVRLNQGAASPFGVFVKEGGVTSSQDGDVKFLTAITDKIAGVLHHTHDIRQDPSTTALVAGVDVPDLSIVPLMEKGKIYCVCEAVAIVAGDPVYVRAIANGAGKLVIGAVSNVIDGVSNTNFLLKGAKFVRAAASTDGIAVVEFDVNAALV